ncbi:hypothetical protein D3C85_1850370 [compost metagenome]
MLFGTNRPGPVFAVVLADEHGVFGVEAVHCPLECMAHAMQRMGLRGWMSG